MNQRIAPRKASFFAAPFLICVLLATGGCGPGRIGDEVHVKSILDEIVQTQLAVRNYARHGRHPCAEEKCVFLAVFDFDGTVLHGDVTEGLVETVAGEPIERYKGLQELAIRAGYSERFQGPDGFDRFQAAYAELNDAARYREAYGFIPRAFAGASARELQEFAASRFTEIYPDYFYAASVDMIRALQEMDVEPHLVSASPHFFVRAAAESLGISPSQAHGIDLRIENGRYADEVLEPLNYAEGKTERIRQILDEARARHDTDNVFVIAGFGNSPHSDGPFLSWIAEQDLPARHAVAVMINANDTGKLPDSFEYVDLAKQNPPPPGRIILVRQSQLMRDVAADE